MAAITAILGLGLAAAGTATSVMGASKQAAAQKEQTGLEKQVEAQRMKAMELDARRKQLEIIRQQQRARSMALTVANSQGASQGSALPGAYGQIAGQTSSNLSGVTENLEIGRNIFGLNSQISDTRISMANAGSTMAFGAGLAGLGGSLMSSSGQLGNVFNSATGSSTGLWNPMKR